MNAISPETALRQPPHNLEAEQAVLGAILTRNRSLERVGEFLRAEHFVSAAHRKIYDVIIAITERGQQADVVTIKAALESDRSLHDIGGVGYLLELVKPGVGIINVGDYGRVIHDLYLRRELIAIQQEGIEAAWGYDAAISADAVAEGVASRIFDLQGSGKVNPDACGAESLLRETIAQVDVRRKSGGGITGVRSGLADLDSLTGGFQPSNLIILGARPAMGKSGLAATMALNAAMSGTPTLIYSLEMGGTQFGQRWISAKTGVDLHRIVTGSLSDDEMIDVATAGSEIGRLPLWVDDTSDITAAGIASRARRWHRRHNIGLVIVDYLQLISADGRRRDGNAVVEMGDISRALKILAKEIKAPVIALSQLNRAVESRDDKRPGLADLRQSGSIEQDADMVLFLYRQEYYMGQSELEQKPNERPEAYGRRCQEWEEKKHAARGVAEIIIAKNRQGPTGSVKTQFDAPTTAFHDLARDGWQ